MRVVAAILTVLCLANAKTTLDSTRKFSFYSARDFVRLFVPSQNFLPKHIEYGVLPSSKDTLLHFTPYNICAGKKECSQQYIKALENISARKRQLLEAKIALFINMFEHQKYRNDASVYLALAELQYKQEGFFALPALSAYLNTYIKNGGSIRAISRNLAYVLTKDKTPESSIQLVLKGKLDSALFLSGYLPLDGGTQEVFFGDTSRGSTHHKCLEIISKGEQESLLAFEYCVPSYGVLPKLFPFDGNIYWLMPDGLYIAKEGSYDKAFTRYAAFEYTQKNSPFLCKPENALSDKKREANLAKDLANAGFGLDSNAFEKWQEDIACGDEAMAVEYLGHFDVFNNGNALPIVRTSTHIQADISHRFYEAFTLKPTMQADISLSHPIMNIQGRIPNLFFIHLNNTLAGCVLSDDGNEEKVFLFHQNSIPELIAHHRLEQKVTNIQRTLNYTPNKQVLCLDEQLCNDGFLYLGQSILLESKLDSSSIQAALKTCERSPSQAVQTSTTKDLTLYDDKVQECKAHILLRFIKEL